MYRDLEMHARKLDISLNDYSAATTAVNRESFKAGPNKTKGQYIDIIKSLPHDQMIAYIRWNRLDRRFSEAFDWNGVRDDAK